MTQYNSLNVKLSNSQLNKLRSAIKNCKTAKISKTGFREIGYAAVSKPWWVGFSGTKTDCNKFESCKNHGWLML